MFNAEHIERKRRRAHGHDAVLANHAILLPAADKFAGEKQQRLLAAVYQHELIHGSPCRLRNVNLTAIASTRNFLQGRLEKNCWLWAGSLEKQGRTSGAEQGDL